jgi:formylglycine-generating enzyme required for sulfatase activity
MNFTKTIRLIGALLTVLLISCIFASTVFASSSPAKQQKDQKEKEKNHTQEQLKKRHHKRSSTCFACHKDTESPAFKQIMQKSCVQCHKLGWEKGKLDELVKEVDEGPPPGSPTQKAQGQGPGMSVPMYYQKTRMGEKPGEMVLVPAGEFIRGTDNRLPDEGPQYKLNVAAFYIDKYEVTNLQYQYSLQFTHRPPPEDFVDGYYPQGKVDHPVTFVSWYDAKAYCAWAGKRLPTDIEWEKAARGTDGRTYPWGDEFSINYVNSPVRWTTLKLIGDTTPVGAFKKGVSPYGLYDMSGNVWEWTASRYLPYPGNTRKSENYGGNYRVLKGGSWWDCSFYQCGISAPVYNRSFFNPKTKNNSFGFRCAKDAIQ